MPVHRRRPTGKAAADAPAGLAAAAPALVRPHGVQSGLAMGSIVVLGSAEQRERWLPDMYALRSVGAFALTEPHGGSDVARGLETTARREGDEWVLDGEKRWIGNATFADLTVVWARDLADDKVKGFVVHPGRRAFTRPRGALGSRRPGAAAARRCGPISRPTHTSRDVSEFGPARKANERTWPSWALTSAVQAAAPAAALVPGLRSEPAADGPVELVGVPRSAGCCSAW